MKGKFISIEGCDGSGKTTNVKILVGWLQDHGYDVVYTREPGGTPIGEKIRELLLNNKMFSKTEVLLFNAARCEHIETLIKPALAEGKIVVCDRYVDSSYAYQAAGRGLFAAVEAMEQFVSNATPPDHTLFFDVTLEESLKRLNIRTNGKLDVFEQEDVDFRTRVYTGYKNRYKHKLARMHHINAMLSPEEVAKQVISWAEKHF